MIGSFLFFFLSSYEALSLKHHSQHASKKFANLLQLESYFGGHQRVDRMEVLEVGSEARKSRVCTMKGS
jgi:hypothetical protein